MGLCLACLEAQVEGSDASEEESSRELQPKERRRVVSDAPVGPGAQTDPRYYQQIIDQVQSKFINLSLFQAQNYADEQDDMDARNSVKFTDQKVAASRKLLSKRPQINSMIDSPEKATDALAENPDFHSYETLASQFAAIANSHAFAVIGDHNDPAVIILSSRPQQVTS